MEETAEKITTVNLLQLRPYNLPLRMQLPAGNCSFVLGKKDQLLEVWDLSLETYLIFLAINAAHISADHIRLCQVSPFFMLVSSKLLE